MKNYLKKNKLFLVSALSISLLGAVPSDAK